MLRAVLLLLVLALPGAIPAAAQSTITITDNYFTGDERRTIQGYYRASAEAPRPAGPARAGSALPAHYAKLIKRGQSLPAGLYYTGLPPDLSNQLPRRPQHARIIIGYDVLLIERSSNVIRDILVEALRGN